MRALNTARKTKAPEPVLHRVARIIRVTPEGRPVVDYPGNPVGPVTARSTLEIEEGVVEDGDVLLVFEGGDPSLPIVVGRVHDRLYAEPRDLGRPRDVVIDGRVLVFEGRDEVVLRCGKGSISLRADGTVVVRGSRLLSRASETNRIKGASVEIN